MMLLIICHHYVVNSGLLTILKLDPFSYNSIAYYLFGAWGKTAINGFVIITGYYMCDRQISLKKFLLLIAQVYFYNFIISSLFYITGYHNYSIRELFSLLFPIHGINTNFTDCYLIFFLLIPFLNRLIRTLDKRKHFFLACILLFAYSIVAFPHFGYSVSFNYVSWFCVLYIISSYTRFYPLRYDNKLPFWTILTVIMGFVGICSIFYSIYRGDYLPYGYISESNQILSFLIAFSSFMMFKNLRIAYSPVVNVVASTTFGILLIHANSDVMRTWLWKDMIDCVDRYYMSNSLLFAFAAVIAVFCICAIIDLCRRFIFETFLDDRIEKFVKFVNKCPLWQKKV